VGALIFLPRGIYPELLSSTTVAGALPFGRKALVIALAGTMACLAGAAVETSLSGGYNMCQFYNLPWGKNRPVKEVRAFTANWVGMIVVAGAMVVSGLRPLQLVNISVVFSMVLMPFTYYPILRVAMDKNIMGKHVNRLSDTALGAAVLVLIVLAAFAAIPLMIVTDSGRP
jgi:Mn2+/Fe2+ NRAMP family transporter